jgi:hypothetical protein
MKHRRHESTGRRGWFVGDFPEAAFKTDLCEVTYLEEEIHHHPPHRHTKCHEILLIVEGSVKCNDQIYYDGDILIFEPMELVDVEYLEKTKVVAVKTPAGGNDKILV